MIIPYLLVLKFSVYARYLRILIPPNPNPIRPHGTTKKRSSRIKSPSKKHASLLTYHEGYDPVPRIQEFFFLDYNSLHTKEGFYNLLTILTLINLYLGAWQRHKRKPLGISVLTNV